MNSNAVPPVSGGGNSVSSLSFALGFLVWGTVWMVLTEWNAGSLVVGLPTAVLAGYLYARTRAGRVALPAPIPLARFLPYFVWKSLLSGVDIAVRVLSPRVRVAPGFFVHETALEQAEARVFFANTVSLIPGTLSVMFEGDRLHVHTIDVREPNQANLRQLERQVAALFRDEGQHGEYSA